MSGSTMGETMEWSERFLGLASHVAQWSKDPSTKVGCVIVDDDHHVVSVGYNGFPTEVRDYPERYEDRGMKYALVVHAELNAIYSAARLGVSLLGTTLYCTMSPCGECMKAIIQVGIDTVLFRDFREDPTAALLASEAGILLVRRPE